MITFRNLQRRTEFYTKILNVTLFFETKPPSNKIDFIDSFSTSVESADENLQKLSRRDLIDRIRRLEVTNTSLKKVAAKRNLLNAQNTPKYRNDKNFKTNLRHVALKIAYLGWDWDGFTSDDNSKHTIEKYLLNALLKTCLIDDPHDSNYRHYIQTEPGVSAFGQVITLDLKTNLSKGQGVKPAPGQSLMRGSSDLEIRYPQILNKALPGDIRVVAWAPLPDQFDVLPDEEVTFTCFFPVSDLDLDLMRNEVGTWDGGRQISKHIDNTLPVLEMFKIIKDIKIRDLSTKGKSVDQNSSESNQEYMNLCELTVTGLQLTCDIMRKLVEYLIFIGQKIEDGCVDRETDIVKNLNLNMVRLGMFEAFSWHYDQGALVDAALHFQKLHLEFSIKAAIVNQTLATVTPNLDYCVKEFQKMGESSTEFEMRNKIISKPYRSVLFESLTPLDRDLLLKGYTCFEDFIRQRKARMEERF